MACTLDDHNKELQFRLQVVDKLKTGIARELGYLSELRHLRSQALRLVVKGNDKVRCVVREFDARIEEVSACTDALSYLLADQNNRVDYLEWSIEEAEWIQPSGIITGKEIETFATAS
jgi:hypothetical protein